MKYLVPAQRCSVDDRDMPRMRLHSLQMWPAVHVRLETCHLPPRCGAPAISCQSSCTKRAVTVLAKAEGSLQSNYSMHALSKCLQDDNRAIHLRDRFWIQR